MNDPRTATVERSTSETEIRLTLGLDGTGKASIQTGIGFLDHMLTALAKHGRLDLDLQVNGDLDVDDHHSVEDAALSLGTALDQALGDRRGIERFAHAYAPLDEALARVVVDLSGRPYARVQIPFVREMVGDVATENLVHFFQSLAMTGRLALHVDVLEGENDHHKAEAAFKALAIALRRAVARTGESDVPSTKGSL
ncbi:MAG TPA: imidazoleglycerol-phosphate dehydratase HisB [Geminicoccus sp.]|uniref:imidazoleglycerol-phosphate dehydratase HisB n=1 Tax=Geminicoccus sp. TaxID=2024832 RepID=UPI002E31CC09|nr:imidazoleglycerol-phosphate dehydratase HisB [Geminicoccus sp.]HEX2525094.1 imidazoleglycerol-phosphate dehydratase HisB [Geminicoccus sp.]